MTSLVDALKVAGISRVVKDAKCRQGAVAGFPELRPMALLFKDADECGVIPCVDGESDRLDQLPGWHASLGCSDGYILPSASIFDASWPKVVKTARHYAVLGGDPNLSSPAMTARFRGEAGCPTAGGCLEGGRRFFAQCIGTGGASKAPLGRPGSRLWSLGFLDESAAFVLLHSSAE